MMRTILTGTAAALLASGTAFGIALDMDNNNYVEEDEFRAAANDAELFAVYDLDSDGVLTEDEFYAVVFDAYDADNDGKWSQTEAGVWEDSRLTSGFEKSQ